jgi:hypothetical protein
LTRTYQKGGWFTRGDVAIVHASSFTLGRVFGGAGSDANQFRAVLEFGFIFGSNISGR